jgi:environmental stress-induced protein Ves
MITLYGPADYREQIWKNGGGHTCELRRAPHPTTPDTFAWRLSIATISQSGPFSVFPGIDRAIMLLDGEGMGLSIGSADEQLLTRRGEPLHFPGEVPVHCRLLRGPVRDFNLMTDRELFHATLRIVTLPIGSGTQSIAPLTLMYLLEGELRLRGGEHAPSQPVAAGELVEASQLRQLNYTTSGGAQAAVAELTRR